ncbi:hypothetical protein VSX61_10580 [Brenneria populi subsp. brevivirga]|uniref:hypothetical protein n=1 Tax=Brenneria populi TaxID=1505588 RepID=UPI002E197AE3|nr:hypothetical protein [Brenneria populi subsp. brevivirga]
MFRHGDLDWRATRGAVAVEMAFLIPVVLVGVMMLVELARIGLLIAVGSAALDKAALALRLDASGAGNAEQIAARLKVQMIGSAYGYLHEDDLTVSVLHFNNLRRLGGLEADSAANDGDASNILPVWSVTVQIKKAFLTSLPTVLTLGDTFRYQYKHVFGTELNHES